MIPTLVLCYSGLFLACVAMLLILFSHDPKMITVSGLRRTLLYTGYVSLLGAGLAWLISFVFILIALLRPVFG